MIRNSFSWAFSIFIFPTFDSFLKLLGNKYEVLDFNKNKQTSIMYFHYIPTFKFEFSFHFDRARLINDPSQTFTENNELKKKLDFSTDLQILT